MSWLKRIYEVRIYLVIGLVHVGSLGFLLVNQQPQSSVNAYSIPVQKELKKNTLSGRPVKLRVPSLNIELEVKEGYFNSADSSWTLSPKNAHFAMPTARANNEAGNTLVYGHNNRYVFASLANLRPGAVAEITTDNGHRFYYAFESAKSYSPVDLSVFTYEGPPILTLQTCTGNWYELRTMSQFKFIKVVAYNPNEVRDNKARDELFNSLQEGTNAVYPQASIVSRHITTNKLQ
jgi:hypothetical protein